MPSYHYQQELRSSKIYFCYIINNFHVKGSLSVAQQVEGERVKIISQVIGNEKSDFPLPGWCHFKVQDETKQFHSRAIFIVRLETCSRRHSLLYFKENNLEENTVSVIPFHSVPLWSRGKATVLLAFLNKMSVPILCRGNDVLINR